MTLTAFILVISAACFHALWNLVAKRLSGNLGAFWLGLCFISLMLAPFALFAAPQGFNSAGLPYIAATGFFHALYFGSLGAAYRHGEISVVYPLARGSSVAGTAVMAPLLLGERVSALGALGIGLVCLGILALGLWELFKQQAHFSSILPALLVGATTTAYSIVDKRGVGYISPVIYIAGLSTCAALLLAPYVLLKCREQYRRAWRESKLACLAIGLGSMGTYLVILFAFQFANASYVVAVREFSIVVVALLGTLVLRESISLPRGCSILVILIGVLLVKMS